MRDIKFRAWHGAENKMYMLEKANYLGQTGIIDIYVGCAEAIWMQYTGLKDKNDVEIYEGDILAQRPYCYFKSDGTKDKRVKQEWTNLQTVEWGEWRDFSGGYEAEPGTFIGWSINPEDLKEAYRGDTSEKLEVIGNIYENPDLLT